MKDFKEDLENLKSLFEMGSSPETITDLVNLMLQKAYKQGQIDLLNSI